MDNNSKNVNEKEKNKKENNLLKRFIEKIDKKMQEKAKKNSCCKGKGCC